MKKQLKNVKPLYIGLIIAEIIAIVPMIFIPLPALTVQITIVINIVLGLLVLLSAVTIKKDVIFHYFLILIFGAAFFNPLIAAGIGRYLLLNRLNSDMIFNYTNSVMVIGMLSVLTIMVFMAIIIRKYRVRVKKIASTYSLNRIADHYMKLDMDLSLGEINEKEAANRRAIWQKSSKVFRKLDSAAGFIFASLVICLTITGLIMGIGTLQGMFVYRESAITILHGFIPLAGMYLLAVMTPLLLLSNAIHYIVTAGEYSPVEPARG